MYENRKVEPIKLFLKGRDYKEYGGVNFIKVHYMHA
jgi:hypothetical protein